jgi:hypothetical protein
MTDRRLVTVFRSREPAELDAIAEVLRDAGLHVHRAAPPPAGIFGRAMEDEGLLDVPADEEDVALATLAKHFDEPEELYDGDDSWKDELAAETARLRPLLAAGMTLFCASHFYARRVLTGAFLWLGQALAFWTMSRGTWEEGAIGSLLSLSILVYDFVGGQIAVRSYNRGLTRGRVVQALTGVLVVLGLGALASLLGPPLAARVRMRYPNLDKSGYGNGVEIRSSSGANRLPFPFHLEF